jgi:cyclopropane-fatty-acyl-phospholipid synthase
MNVLTIEQSKAAYWADFAFYGATIVVLAVALVVGTPHTQWPRVAFLAITGVGGWSVLEYLVHRFLFHGVQPFRRWHAEHHARPTAFICAPTIVTASVLGMFHRRAAMASRAASGTAPAAARGQTANPQPATLATSGPAIDLHGHSIAQ